MENINTTLHTQEPVIFFTILAILLVINFIPSMIAFSRQHSKRLLILVLNIFFAWTGIVWLLLLVWALKGQRD